MMTSIGIHGEQGRDGLGKGGRSKGRPGSWILLALPVLGLSTLVGCQTGPGPAETRAQRQAAMHVKVSDTVADGTAAAYTTADGYPDLSRPLTAANVQMSNDDAGSQEKRLAGLASLRKSGRISEAEYNRRVEEMRKLAVRPPVAPAPATN